MPIELTRTSKVIAQKAFRGQPITASEAETLILELGAEPLPLSRGKGAHRLYRVPNQKRPCSIPWHSSKQELGTNVLRSFKQLLRANNVTKTGEIVDDQSS